MKIVCLRAPLLSCSGYGVHARQIFRWLKNQPNIQLYTNIVPWGITPWVIDSEAMDGVIGQIMEASIPPPRQPDVSFQLQLPNEWDSSLAAINIGMSAMVETDTCNPAWLEAINSMDAVVVPSSHSKKSVDNTGAVSTPIFVVPESYYDSIVNPSLEPFNLPTVDTDFNFLILGQLTGQNPFNDRKNLFFTIKWMCEVFKNDPNVGIIVKTNTGRATAIDRVMTERTLRNLISEVREGPYPKVHLLHGFMNQDEIAGLYRNPKIKALVSLTRGEGFGLPILEATCSGLPVIATNWSAHLDFMNIGKFIKIAYRLNPIHESRIDNTIFMEGARWAEPVEEDVKKRFLKFRHSSDMPKKWATDLGEILKEKYSQSAIEKIYTEKLGKYLL
jgi:glycosyltransferase involved in cell wall biosynthesis